MRKARHIFLPIFNAGQGLFICIIVFLYIIIGITIDIEMAIYIFIFSYLGIVMSYLLLGLAPAEAVIRLSAIDSIREFLNTADNLSVVEEYVWAPKKFESWWWASDRISIIRSSQSNEAILRARERDVRIILKKFPQAKL